MVTRPKTADAYLRPLCIQHHTRWGQYYTAVSNGSRGNGSKGDNWLPQTIRQ